MDKTSEKVTKDPKHVQAGRKGRENYMKKYKESILNDAKKVAEMLPMQAMKLPALLTMKATKLPALPTPPPQDQMIPMSMVLLFLPLVFVYFMHTTLSSLKLSMKNRINHQDVICFRKNIQKISSFDWKKNIEDSIKDGLIITIRATEIVFGLKTVNVKLLGASLGAKDIVKRTGLTCGGVLIKDYAV